MQGKLRAAGIAVGMLWLGTVGVLLQLNYFPGVISSTSTFVVGSMSGLILSPLTKKGVQASNSRLKSEALLVTFGSILGPLWRVAGFALGAATALMGEKAAMACTVAVEEVIDEHYQQQSERLSGDTHQDEPMLKSTIDEFRAEELQHRDTALGLGAADTVGYPVLSAVIKTGSRAAIWLSERF